MLAHYPKPRRKNNAFTRIELAAILAAAVVLLGVVIVPATARTKSDLGRITCFNNLRGIARGVQTWANDHNRRFPWRSRPLVEGGTTEPMGAAWIEFHALSNELVTPKILACPSDIGVRHARMFDWGPEGLVQLGYRENSVSYPLHLDGSLDVPHSWLSGDRNISSGALQRSACSVGFENMHAIATQPQLPPPLGWTNAVHGFFGHMATTDGSVEFTSGTRMREIILQQGISDDGQLHFLNAR